jgi:hypothetical protein
MASLPEPVVDWGKDGPPSRDWTISFEEALKGATWAAGLDNVNSSLTTVVPKPVVDKIVKAATGIFHKEPTLLEVCQLISVRYSAGCFEGLPRSLRHHVLSMFRSTLWFACCS